MSDQWSFAMTVRHCKDYIAIWENGFLREEGNRKNKVEDEIKYFKMITCDCAGGVGLCS